MSALKKAEASSPISGSAVISQSSGQLLRGDGAPFLMVHQYQLAEQLKGYANIR